MASESRKVILIVGAIVVLGVGGALYYLLVVQPQQDRKSAQAEITAWEAHWAETRGCLLGDKPLAADVTDAITARELVAGTTDAAMGDCTRTVGGLGRPPGTDTGVADVERAWSRLELATREVAEAYATHRASPLGDNPLPAALDALAAAHAALRAAAGMSPPPPGDGPALTTLAPAPITLDGATVSDLGGITVDGTLRGRANVTGKGPYDITWTTAGLTGAPGSSLGVGSVPDHTWQLVVKESDGDEADTMTAVGGGATAATALVERGANLIPLLALGAAQGRIAIYSVDGHLHVARSADAGATWQPSPVPAPDEVAFSGSPLGDKVTLAWADPAKQPDSLMVLALTTAANAAGPLPAPTALPAQALATWCTGGALWLVGGTATGYTVFANAAPPGVALSISEPRPVACNDQVVVLRGRGGDGAEQACTATACRALPPTGADRAYGVVGGHVYRADSRGRIVAIWRDAEPPVFYRLAAPRDVYGVVDVGGAPVLLLVDTAALALEQAALP
jgi:hypothetical protein